MFQNPPLARLEPQFHGQLFTEVFFLKIWTGCQMVGDFEEVFELQGAL